MKLETKVGAFFVGTLVVLGSVVLRLEKIELFSKKGSGREYTVEFDQVAGLNPNNPVRIAGVKMGEVRRITLNGNRAVVNFILWEDIPVHTDAVASLSSIGILGEKYIELDPGHPNTGQLTTVRRIKGISGVSMDALLKTLDVIATDVRGITASLNQTLGGEAGRQKLDEIVDNIRVLTGEFRAMAQENRGSINRTMVNVEAISGDLRERLPQLAKQFETLGRSLNALVEENRPELKGLTSDVRKLAQGFQGTSDNLKSITDKINSGQGTIGKLLTDETTIKKINSAVDNVNELMGGLKNLELRLDMSATRWTRRGDSNTGLDLELAPRKDYWYAVGLHSTPDGKVMDSLRTVTKIDPVTGLPKDVLEKSRTVTTDQSFTLSAQFAKRLGDHFVVSAGIIDGQGGAGAEVRALEDRLRVGVQAYDFTKREGKENPRIRIATSYQFYKGLYLQAGIQDAANKDLRSFFGGGGIRWKDEDLKKLVGLASSAK